MPFPLGSYSGPAFQLVMGWPFRTVLRDLALTSNQVWGLTRTDEEWSEQLEAALRATRRDDLQHGTNAAYVRGCVCGACREYQRVRMSKNRQGDLRELEQSPHTWVNS
jgi:hypothetical protein